ncbi:MAG: PBP1A family penicillin-binding protein [Alphaproteobacteria bacterium]|nr:PBP1A family penicillin-binding protein [Alphaproteobacteria bacterium]
MAPRKKRTTSSRKPSRRDSEGRTFGGFLLHAFVLCAIWGVIVAVLYVGYCALDLPDVHDATQPPRRPSVVIEAADETVFARYGDFVGKHVTVAELPRYVPEAVIAIEDRRFYRHFGIDPIGIARAALRDLIAGHTVEGGSTLTQQLAKNLFLSPQRTIKRKVQEMLLALWLEHTYTKNQILSAYLNRVYLGSGAYGIDAAAHTYFHKSATELNIREAAIIAGLLRAPTRYSPMNNPEAAMERAKIVLKDMVEQGYITRAQRRAAIAYAPPPEHSTSAGGAVHYFADWIYNQIGPLVQDTQRDMVVKTTLSLPLERDAEKQIDATLNKYGKARHVSQAALVTLAPDGAVRAMVGGRNYRESQFNRVTQALRQPGSSFKPIVYLAAIEGGLKPDDILMDEPITVGDYSPVDYDKHFQGPVTARHALADSINTVAVRLFVRVGAAKVVSTARDLGITSPLERDAALALGASEVSPLELATAYAAIASGGKAISPYAVREIDSRSGQVLYRHPEVTPPQVVDANADATLINMMQSVVTDGTGKKAALGGRPVAGKTGTTSDYRDAWFAGFTADYTTVVWMGNDDNTPMKYVTGGLVPAELWHNYMMEAERGLPERPLSGGGNILQRAINGAGAVAGQAVESLGDFINSILGKH